MKNSKFRQQMETLGLVVALAILWFVFWYLILGGLPSSTRDAFGALAIGGLPLIAFACFKLGEMQAQSKIAGFDMGVKLKQSGAARTPRYNAHKPAPQVDLRQLMVEPAHAKIEARSVEGEQVVEM